MSAEESEEAKLKRLQREDPAQYEAIRAEEKRKLIASEPILQFFEYGHLPAPLQAVSRGFCEAARDVAVTIPRNPERSVCLRKLLEAKDACVRAVLYK